jgi:hypothetical protein
MIALGAVTVGALFENKSWVRIVELLRLLSYAGWVVYYVYWLNSPEWLLHVAITYTFISIIWLFNALSANAKKLQNALQ